MVIYEVSVYKNSNQLNSSHTSRYCADCHDVGWDGPAVNAVTEGVRLTKPAGALHLRFTRDLWELLERCWLRADARPEVGDILSCLNDTTWFWNAG